MEGRELNLSDLAHGVLLVLRSVGREGLGGSGSLGSLGSAVAADKEEGTGSEEDNNSGRDTTGNSTDVGLVRAGTAGDVVGLGNGGVGGVGVAVGQHLETEDLVLAETHAVLGVTRLAERLVLGALLEHADAIVAGLPLWKERSGKSRWMVRKSIDLSLS